MKELNKYFLLFASVFIASCTQKLEPSEYMQYVHDTKNGLRKEVKAAGWVYTFQYRPTALISFVENKSISDSRIIAKRMIQLEGTAWFNISFRISDGKISPMRYNLTSRQEYDVRYNYFLNEASKGIRLIHGGKDTLIPMSYLFENNYNLTPQETMIVGFHLPKQKEFENDIQLCYEDHMFNTGTIKVIFRKEDLNSIPKLAY